MAGSALLFQSSVKKMEYLLVMTLKRVGDVRFIISKCYRLVKDKSMLNMSEEILWQNGIINVKSNSFGPGFHSCRI